MAEELNSDKLKRIFKDIADKIRRKKGVNITMTPSQMPAMIESMETETKYGMDICTIMGDLSQTGKISKSTNQPKVKMTGLITVPQNGLTFKFAGMVVVEVDLSDLRTVGNEGLYGAFFKCENLKKVDMRNLSSVGTNALTKAFQFCTNLDVVDFSNASSVIPIPNTDVFKSAKSSYKVVVPDNLLTTWKAATNWSNAGIVSHIISRSDYIKTTVTYMDNTTSSFVIDGDIVGSSNTPTSQITNVQNMKSAQLGIGVADIGDYAFYGCSNLTSMTLSDNVTEIGESAFQGCGLTSITLTPHVQFISSKAFQNCSSLAFVYMDSLEQIPVLENIDAFSGLSSDYILTISSDLYEEWIASTNWSNDAVKSHIAKPTIVTFIDGSVRNFFLAGNVTGVNSTTPTSKIDNVKDAVDIKIADGVTAVSNYCFITCTKLQSITLPQSVTSIGYATFQNCTSLKAIDIPSGVSVITNNAFYNCHALESVTFNGTISYIGQDTFRACWALKNMVFPNGMTITYNRSFYQCSGLESVTFPNSLLNIKESSFEECESLTGVVIPPNVTEIGDYAFAFCDLRSINIPAPCTYVGEGAFDENPSFTEFVVDANNTEYASVNGLLLSKDEETLFIVPSGSTSVTIPNTVTTMEAYAVYGCRNLTSLTIPSSVTYIADGAMMECTKLTSIDIPDSVTSCDSSVLWECTSLTNVTIGSGLRQIPSNMFYGCYNLKVVDFSKATSQVTLQATNAFPSSANYKIVVPDSLYSSWISATNWASLASKIISHSDYIASQGS